MCTLVLLGEKHLLSSSLCTLHGSYSSMLLITSNTGPAQEHIATSRTSLFLTMQAFSSWVSHELELIRIFSVVYRDGIEQFVKLSLSSIFDQLVQYMGLHILCLGCQVQVIHHVSIYILLG